MLKARVDDRRFRQAARGWARGQAAAEKVVVMDLGEEFVRLLLKESPQDTRRYIAGWIQAANQAGIGGGIPVPAIRRSKYADKLIVRLERQLIFLQKQVARAEEAEKFWAGVYANRYERYNRRDRWAMDCLRKLEKARKRAKTMSDLVQFASDQLSKFKNGDAGEIVIWGKKEARVTAKRAYASVRDKVYGGTGRWRRAGYRTFLELKNNEAHASLVEASKHPVRYATLGTYGQGLRKVQTRSVRMIARSWAAGVATGDVRLALRA